MITVHLKSGYAGWKEIFDNDSGARAEYCNESRTMVAQVDERTALIAMFDVDQAKMQTRLSSPEFAKMVEDTVVKHDAYELRELPIG
jgi:hypothetical protein